MTVLSWLIPFIAPGCACVYSPVAARHVGYVVYTEEKLDDADGALKDLKAKRSDIKKRIIDADRSRKESTSQATRWMQKVEDMDNKVETNRSNYKQSGCLLGCCPLHRFSSHEIGRRAAKQLKDMEKMKNEIGKPEELVMTRPPCPVIEINHTVNIVGTEIESNLEQMRVYLTGDDVGIVGIWGMPGVGKTTLLQAVNNGSLFPADDGTQARRFDHVIWAAVSQGVDLEKVRRDIAERLGLSDTTNDAIFGFLKNKNFLLLLDDLWRGIDLRKLGVPHPYRPVANKPKHKVVFTTRLESVCGEMEARKTIAMNCLKPEEAWQLFKKKATEDTINSNPAIQALAGEVVKECRGLPLALITIGTAMSKTLDPKAWWHALTELKKARTETIRGKIYPDLELSYRMLRNDEVRECFLSCALWLEGRDIRIDDLIECWIGLGLISGDDIKDAYNYGHHLIGELVDACLLERSGLEFSTEDQIVKMHTVIRDMALLLVSNHGKKKNMWVVEQVAQVEESAQLEKWREAERVSVRFLPSEEVQLQQPLGNCPNLSVLILQGDCISMIPSGFFQNMPSLTYLDLSKTKLKELPKDICCLVKLQYLNLANTKIYQLPDEVGLVDLRFLRMSCKGSLCENPQSIRERFPAVCVLDLLPHGELGVQELQFLKGRLKALSMRVSMGQVLKPLSQACTWYLSLVTLAGVTSLELPLLGRNKAQCLRELKITKCDDLNELVMDSDTKVWEEEIHPLGSLEMLLLSRLPRLQSVVWKRNVPSQSFLSLRYLQILECKLLTNANWALRLPCLTVFIVSSCDMMVEVISGADVEAEKEGGVQPCFLKLRRLELSHCEKLSSICDEAVNFPSLEEIEVRECPILNKLPFNRENTGNKLRNIIGQLNWWESLDWEAKPSFLPFFTKLSEMETEKAREEEEEKRQREELEREKERGKARESKLGRVKKRRSYPLRSKRTHAKKAAVSIQLASPKRSRTQKMKFDEKEETEKEMEKAKMEEDEQVEKEEKKKVDTKEQVEEEEEAFEEEVEDKELEEEKKKEMVLQSTTESNEYLIVGMDMNKGTSINGRKEDNDLEDFERKRNKLLKSYCGKGLLGPKEEEAIEAMLNLPVEKFRAKILAVGKSFTSIRDCYYLLDNYGLVYDDTIHVYQSMLEAEQEHLSSKSSIFMSPIFMNMCLSEGRDEAMKDWGAISRDKLGLAKRIFVPLHTGNHWHLLVVDMEFHVYFHYDSMSSGSDQIKNTFESAVDVMKGLLMERKEDLPVSTHDPLDWDALEVEDAPRQELGTVHCAIFVMKYIENVHHGYTKFDFDKENMVRLRGEICSLILMHRASRLRSLLEECSRKD